MFTYPNLNTRAWWGGGGRGGFGEFSKGRQTASRVFITLEFSQPPTCLDEAMYYVKTEKYSVT